MTGTTLVHLTAVELVTLTLLETQVLSHSLTLSLCFLPLFCQVARWMIAALPFRHSRVSISNGSHYLLSLSLSCSPLYGRLLLWVSFLMNRWCFKKKDSQEVLRLFACFVRRPVSPHNSTLSLSCFLPVSPPSHIHKSKTQQLPQPSHPYPPFTLPLLSSLKLPPALFIPFPHSCPAKISWIQKPLSMLVFPLSSPPIAAFPHPLFSSTLYSEAPPFSPCFPTLAYFLTVGFLSADRVSMFCSLSSEGI